jgi:hypothetical protein
MGSKGCGDSKLGQVSMATQRGGFKCIWQFKELGSNCYGNEVGSSGCGDLKVGSSGCGGLKVGSSGCGESITKERT